jgi:hypothetical protein
MTRMILMVLVAASLVVIGVTPAPSRAAVRQDWSAWLGCWQPTGTDAQPGVLVCLLPGQDEQSVRMLTIAGNTVREETTIRPDGVARPAAEGGCTGAETATWSSDRRRVFIRTELECGSIDRTATSVMAFVASNEFIDAQAVTVEKQHTGRAVRYRLVPAGQVPPMIAAQLGAERALLTETARLNAFVPLDVDDVIEAAGKVAPPAVAALLAARNHGFPLDAAALLRLERAGVAKSVMNVMIALTYPERFNVTDRTVVAQEESAQDAWQSCIQDYYRDWRYDMSCGRYYAPSYFDYYGYRSRYGYGFGGYYNPWYSTPVVVVVRGEDELVPGEVIKGQGYTSGTTRATGSARPRSASGTSSSSGIERSSGSIGSSSSGSSSSGSSSGSSSTGSSSTGSSSGSSGGTSTGRTAIPRGGGGS